MRSIRTRLNRTLRTQTPTQQRVRHIRINNQTSQTLRHTNRSTNNSLTHTTPNTNITSTTRQTITNRTRLTTNTIVNTLRRRTTSQLQRNQIARTIRGSLNRNHLTTKNLTANFMVSNLNRTFRLAQTLRNITRLRKAHTNTVRRHTRTNTRRRQTNTTTLTQRRNQTNTFRANNRRHQLAVALVSNNRRVKIVALNRNRHTKIRAHEDTRRHHLKRIPQDTFHRSNSTNINKNQLNRTARGMGTTRNRAHSKPRRCNTSRPTHIHTHLQLSVRGSYPTQQRPPTPQRGHPKGPTGVANKSSSRTRS